MKAWNTSNRAVATLHADWPAELVGDEDRSRFQRYADAEAFFDGAQWEGRRQPGDVRLTLNYARALVRKVASYVFPRPVTFSVQADDTQPAANVAERLLADVIAQNDLSRLDVDLCIDASVLGDAAMKVTWDAVSGRPLVVAVDPGSLIARTAPDRPKQVTWIAQRSVLPAWALASVVEAGDATVNEPGRMHVVIEEWTDDRWTVTVDGILARENENPYGWIPYVVASNNARPHTFWGESDLVDLVDVCRELNARLSVLARVLQLSGAPIAVLENVDSSEGITVGPGARWELPKDSKAYLLDLLGSGGVTLHVDYINLLYRALHDLSETPRTAFGDSGRTISGAALEVEVQPLIQKVARKRQQWNAVYQERNRRILDLLERFGGHQLSGLRGTTPIWPEILPSDRDASVRQAVALVDAGIQSRRSAIAALGGNDPEGELALIRDEEVARW